MKRTASMVAISDICNYIGSRLKEKENTWDKYLQQWDKWTVLGEELYTKEQRRLNKELGLHSVNMARNQNAKKNKL